MWNNLQNAKDHLAWLKKTATDRQDNARIVGYEDCLRAWIEDTKASEQAAHQPVEITIKSIRDAFVPMGAVCRALEVARLHHEEKKHGEAEMMFNAALDILKQIPEEKRIEICDVLEKLTLPKRELGWQPIETAPRDGDWILAISEKGDLADTDLVNFVSGKWRTAYAVVPVEVDGWKLTQWMPLPNPPTKIEDQSHE